MKIIYTGKKNKYQIIRTILLLGLVLLLCIINGWLFIGCIRQNIGTIGIFSEYMETEKVNYALNAVMAEHTNQAYNLGEDALEKAGYPKTSFVLTMISLRDVLILEMILCVVLVVVYLVMRYCQQQAYSRNVHEVVDWIHNTGELSEENWKGYVPQEVLNAIQELKKQNVQQQMMWEEDTTQIVKYMENISHQLKTPLAVISAVCENTMVKFPEIEGKMMVCMEQTEKMNVLIRDFLQLGRFECSKQKMNFCYVVAADIIETVANNLENIASKKQVSVRITGNKKIIWCCDVFWMEEIIGNILKNCIEHSEKSDIYIMYEQKDRMNQILIKDSGVGFTKGYEKKIFERYAFSDRSNGTGSGLGLSIAMQAIKLHFGTITARNGQDGGVEFKIVFPRLEDREMYHLNCKE